MSESLELTLPGDALVDLIRSMLIRGSSVKIKAAGRSMFPFIRSGDVVTLSALGGLSPRIGDVVALRVNGSGQLALHRVAAKTHDCCLTRGDNCDEPDGLATKDDLLGRVSAVERNGTAVSLGLGLERRLIAFLSKYGLLSMAESIFGRN